MGEARYTSGVKRQRRVRSVAIMVPSRNGLLVVAVRRKIGSFQANFWVGTT